MMQASCYWEVFSIKNVTSVERTEVVKEQQNIFINKAAHVSIQSSYYPVNITL